MRSHRATRLTSVPNGMAVLDAWAQVNRFRMKMREKVNPGKSRAV